MPFSALATEVVAAAEALAVAGERDHVHGGIEVRALDARGELARRGERDAVAALGPVQRDARDRARRPRRSSSQLHARDVTSSAARRRRAAAPRAPGRGSPGRGRGGVGRGIGSIGTARPNRADAWIACEDAHVGETFPAARLGIEVLADAAREVLDLGGDLIALGERARLRRRACPRRGASSRSRTRTRCRASGSPRCRSPGSARDRARRSCT